MFVCAGKSHLVSDESNQADLYVCQGCGDNDGM